MKFLVLSFFVLFSLFSLTNCSSKKSSCGCPYQSGIQKEILPLDDFKFNTLLQADTTDRYAIYACPEAVLENIRLLNPIVQKQNSLSAEIIREAFKYRGVKYRRGGLSEKGLDCSGLVFKCFSKLGFSLPRTSTDMAKRVFDINDGEAQVGDLIFFKTSRRKNVINHVGIVSEINGKEIKFIHASIGKGVIESSTLEEYYAKRYVKVGRIKTVGV